MVRLNPTLRVGLGLTGGWCLLALVAALMPESMGEPVHGPLLAPLSRAADGSLLLLGSDALGRDFAFRLALGAGRALVLGGAVTLLSTLLGGSVGLLASYRGGWVERVLTALSDWVLAFPALVLLLVLVQLGGSGGLGLVLVLAIAWAPVSYRLARSLGRDLAGRDYVVAAEMRGEGLASLLFVALLPNLIRPLMQDAALRLGFVIAALGALGFLGLGPPPPAPDWGGLLAEARIQGLLSPHLAVAPVVAIVSLVLGCTLVAEGLRPGRGSRP
ncbi:MAG: ABC transporter permease [Rhodospirillales bacterium]